MLALASDGRPHNAVAGIRGIRRRPLTQVFMSKSGAVLIAHLGLAIATAAVTWLGARHIADAIAHIGWVGLAYVVAWQLAVYVGLGLAWSLVCPGVSAWALIWARRARCTRLDAERERLENAPRCLQTPRRERRIIRPRGDIWLSTFLYQARSLLASFLLLA